MRETEISTYKSVGSQGVLLIIIILAVAARIGSALYQGNEIRELPGVSDQISYHNLSMRVLDGHGFSFDVGWWPSTSAGKPTAHWSYLYVLFLTAVYSIFGPNPIGARLIQAVLTGMLQTLLTWRIGSRLFGPRMGIVASAISAFYAYFIYYGGALMTEAFYIVAILWSIDIATSMTGASNQSSALTGPASWAKLGLACAIAVLFRQVFLLMVPLIWPWIAWKLTHNAVWLSKTQIIGRLAIAAAVLIACIAPWTIRNYRIFDSFVLLNTNSGFAFFWGNHPIHGTRFIPILASETYSALIPEELRGMNEAEMDKALFLRGLGFVREDPARYLRLSISRLREYFKFWPEENSGRASNYARMLSSGIFFPFALLGLMLLLFCRFKGHPTETQPKAPGTSLLLLLGAGYALVHLLTWTLIRYRLPVDAMLVPVAAVGLVAGLRCFKRNHKLYGFIG